MDHDGDMLNSVVLPLMNVNRRTMDGLLNNKEPHQAILFHTNKNSNIGHWISCWTDKHNIIHHDNSFGNPPIMDIQDRVIKYDKSIEQSADSTSCGWYALLNLLYKGKVKSQPF